MAPNRWIIGIYAIGLGVLLTGLGHSIHDFVVTGESLHFVVDVIFLFGSGVGILYGARWHQRHPDQIRNYPRLLGWMGLAAMLAVGLSVVTLYVGSDQVTPGELAEALHIAASFGLLSGLLLGSIEGVATYQTQIAMQERTRADMLEEEREHIAELNDLLRHYILNGVCIIDGYAEKLRTNLPSSRHEPIDAIQEQTNTMTILTEHFEPLGAQHAGTHREAIDLDAAFEAIGDELDGRATLDIDANAIGTYQLPPETIESFELLLHALVTVADDDASVQVRPRDDGSLLELRIETRPIRMSEATATSLFEPIGTGTGLEFYLAKELVGTIGSLEQVGHTADSITVEYRLRTQRLDDGPVGPTQTG